MDLTIRSAHVQDYAQIVALIQAFAEFQGTPEKVSITAEQLLEDEAIFRCLVAEGSNNEIVGFATYFFAYYSWSGKALYLDDLYVKNGFRNRGIGKRLLVSVIDVAKKGKFKKVRWQVSKWNTNAIDFYKSMGASIDATEMNCDYNITTD
jgi:ribosomal protein S18 acetylase RimI-like enzyme